MKIALGTDSALKVRATDLACDKVGLGGADIVQIKAKSHVNEQPVGEYETTLGSKNRAWQAMQAVPDADFSLGVESGICRIGKEWFETVQVTLLWRNGHHVGLGYADRTIYPDWAVDEARRRGFDTTTVGQVLAEKLGFDPKNPHLGLSGGRLSRVDQLTRAIESTLVGAGFTGKG